MADSADKGRMRDYKLSDEILKKIVDGLDYVEEKSGLRDAYTKRPDEYKILPPIDAQPKESKLEEYVRQKTEEKQERPKLLFEAVSDHDSKLINYAEKEVAKIKEGHNMNRPYTRIDNKVEETKTDIIIKEGFGFWQLMYEVSGKITFH